MPGRPASETPTDWEIRLLHLFWEEGALTVDQVREHLRSKRIKRSESALRTILKAMAEKGLLNTESKERTTYYSAAYAKPQMEKKFFSHIAKTLFHGNQQAFVLRALDESAMTPEMIDELEAIIKKHKKNAK